MLMSLTQDWLFGEYGRDASDRRFICLIGFQRFSPGPRRRAAALVQDFQGRKRGCGRELAMPGTWSPLAQAQPL